MNWSSNLPWEVAKQRAQIIAKIRAFFAERDVIEIETPLLSLGTVTDVYLNAFTTTYHHLADTKNTKELFLQTSPEFAMKRLLCNGYQSIYQICKAFRDEEHGRHHNPEFTMLEWYRLEFDHLRLMQEVSDLLVEVLGCKTPSFISYQAVFQAHAHCDPLDTSIEELLNIIERYGKSADWLVEENDLGTLLQYVFSEIIEAKIGLDAPCFVYGFPSSQASLAKINQDDSRVADRFECYYRGIELVNGFNELQCAKSQRTRFIKDNQQRLTKGLPVKPIDENFLSALEKGLPECAGVAMGIDRLIMLALEKDSIEDVITFTIERA